MDPGGRKEEPRAGQDNQGHFEEEGGWGQARGQNPHMPSAKMVLLAPGSLTQFLNEEKLNLISLFHRIIFLSIYIYIYILKLNPSEMVIVIKSTDSYSYSKI